MSDLPLRIQDLQDVHVIVCATAADDGVHVEMVVAPEVFDFPAEIQAAILQSIAACLPGLASDILKNAESDTAPVDNSGGRSA